MTDFKDSIIKALSSELNKELTLEVPPDSKLGDFAFPCFSLAKELKKAPAAIASDLVSKLQIEGVTVKATGPYLNFFIDNELFIKKILSEVLDQKENYGKFESKDKTIVIDYSAPNVAKNMGIHNLRSTIIGQSLCNILRFNGYKVVGVNHLGDWGTQFGKLIWALEKWSSPKELKEKGIVFLNEMYVKFHSVQEESSSEDMLDEARLWFKKIEENDSKALMWWKLFVEISVKDYDALYKRLGIEFNDTKGESFYIKFLEDTIKLLEDKGLTSESEGAQVVEFEEKFGMPPCLLKKTVGATLYGTRDLAAALYRLKEYSPYKILYAVDIAQALHFRQVFKVLELVDSKNKDVFEHIQFGRLSFPDGSMSTRKGNVVLLREVLDKAKEKVLAIINEKNPGLSNKEEVAEMVGVGAVIFEDLSHDRVHNIIFEWDKVLDFQGETAPYIQYSIARINSILRENKFSDLDYSKIISEDDKNLVRILGDYSNVIDSSAKQLKPHVLAKYVLKLAQEFNNYYSKNKIVQKDKDLMNSRLGLIYCVKQVLVNGLKLLGINAPEEM